MPRIEIFILPDGSSRVETRGFVGPGCREASRWVESALGKTTHRQRTPEYYQQEPEPQHEKERP